MCLVECCHCCCRQYSVDECDQFGCMGCSKEARPDEFALACLLKPMMERVLSRGCKLVAFIRIFVS